MDDTTQITGEPISPRRRRVTLCGLVLLHVVVLSVGLFAWPAAGYDNSVAILLIPLVFGDLAAVASLVGIWLALGESSLGKRLTVLFVTMIAIWLAGAVVFSRLDGSDNNSAALVVSILITAAMYVPPSLLITLVLAWLRRRFGWLLTRHGAVVRQHGSKAQRQFGLRHIMLWTLLAAVVLAMLRAAMTDGAFGFIRSDLLPIFVIYSVYGALHGGVALVTVTCIGFYWPRPLFFVLAVVLTGISSAMSVGWIVYWDGEGGIVWILSLPPAVHFAMLAASILLLRLAGYQFTRPANIPAHTPEEVTTT